MRPHDFAYLNLLADNPGLSVDNPGDDDFITFENGPAADIAIYDDLFGFQGESRLN